MSGARRSVLNKFTSSATSRFQYLRYAEILRVDYESLIADIKFIDSTGTRSEVPLTQAMVGPRSFLGGIPEIGSVVVIGWRKFAEANAVPVILGYIPRGYLSKIEYEPTSLVDPNSTAPIDEFPELFGTSRSKYRKIYPGDILASSSRGADFILDSNARMYSSGGDEVFLKSDDHSFSVNTLNDIRSLASGRHTSGLITRNKLLFVEDIFNEDGMIITDHPAKTILEDWGWLSEDGVLLPSIDFSFFNKIILPNGKPYYVVPGPQDYNKSYNAQIFSYTEDRLELSHLSDGTLRVTEAIDGVEIDRELPLIERVYGTYVGNSILSDSDRNLYGRVLRPILFTGNNVIPGDVIPGFVPCSRGIDAEDERLAAAYTYILNRVDGRGKIFICHDKQGHGYYHFPSTSADHPLGAGKSLSLNTVGNIKTVIGKDLNGTSVDITTSGSLDAKLGKNDDGYSINLDTVGAAYINLKGKDSNGFSYRFLCSGQANEQYQNSKSVIVTGSYKEIVSGTKDAQYSKYTLKTQGELSEFVGEKKSITVKANVDASYGEGIAETVIQGDFEQTNMLGSHKTKLLAGDKVVEIVLGNKKNTIITGNVTEDITTGNYEIKVKAGNITLGTKAGNIDISTKAGTITLDATLPVTVKSAIKVVIDAPMVDIGKVLAGGVVSGTGPPNPGGHLDYITGVPIMGSPTVKV